ncbi:hypothetical protein ACFX2I_021081 [Malus domestica]
MSSKTPTPSLESSHGGTYLQNLLNSTRPFLWGELESVDKNMLSLVVVLRSVGAGECWHKHNTFLEHLVDIYRVLKMWKALDSVYLCSAASFTPLIPIPMSRPLTLSASALRPLSLRLFQFLCQPCHF